MQMLLKLLKDLFKIILISLVGFFILGELVCRFMPQFRFQDEPTAVHREDKELGWVLVPNAEFIHTKPCFSVQLKINSHGFRDEEFPLEKNKDTYRILVLGDSLTFGVGVEANESYPEQLEDILNSKNQGRYKYEVINAGVYGWGTHQEYRFLKQRGFDFNPDLIIVSFYNNDVQETYAGEFNVGLPLQPKFPLKKFLSRHSYLYRYLRIHYNLILIKLGIRYPSLFFKSPQDILKDSYPEDLEMIFSKVKDYIVKMNELAYQNNKKIIFIVLPAGFETLAVVDENLVSEVAKSRLFNNKFLELYKLKVYNEIYGFLKDNNMPAIGLLPVLVDVYKRTSLDYLYLKCDSHYTKEANRIVAESIYDFIFNEGFIP